MVDGAWYGSGCRNLAAQGLVLVPGRGTSSPHQPGVTTTFDFTSITSVSETLNVLSLDPHQLACARIHTWL